MRAAGVLLPLFSLPSPYGIGTMGEQAYRFADFLAEAGQRYWQMLPIGPTSRGDSPYQSFSTFAGNPYFIDLEQLERDGLLERAEIEAVDWGGDPGRIDYGLLYRGRYPLLRRAAERFFASPPEGFAAFLERQGGWLEDYALFMALKDARGGASWREWPEPLRRREPQALDEARRACAQDVRFYQMLQYLFYGQWERLRRYANGKGVRIIGDLPIYVAMDSADVWAAPHLFELDERLEPVAVAGCPPDGFSADGQLWGNPLYRWDVMRQDGYDWWVRRIHHAAVCFDITRIDHFRGFDSYYAIPAGDDTARNGVWRQGPGVELFDTVRGRLGGLSLIAEDLGFLTESVDRLLRDSGFPGMKVLQFAFDSRDDSGYLPHHYPRNCVVYTGTHDNDTILGWLEGISGEDRAFAVDYMRLNEAEGYAWGMMKTAWASAGDTVIVTMQDLLGLGREARINTPSTLGGNWLWRMTDGGELSALAQKLRRLTAVYRRLN